MNFQQYLEYFQSIIENQDGNLPELYQNPEYMEYTKLNWSRMNRWLKTGVLREEVKQKIHSVPSPQHWIVITEPWCGDASHIVPFIELIARENQNIKVTYELRDSEPFRIDNYLTNGGKAIPILIVQEAGTDKAVWGPRPAGARELFASLKNSNAEFETVKIELQKWYNHDKGVMIQTEIAALL
jgi:hypothetical protein